MLILNVESALKKGSCSSSGYSHTSSRHCVSLVPVPHGAKMPRIETARDAMNAASSSHCKSTSIKGVSSPSTTDLAQTMHGWMPRISKMARTSFSLVCVNKSSKKRSEHARVLINFATHVVFVVDGGINLKLRPTLLTNQIRYFIEIRPNGLHLLLAILEFAPGTLIQHAFRLVDCNSTVLPSNLAVVVFTESRAAQVWPVHDRSNCALSPVLSHPHTLMHSRALSLFLCRLSLDSMKLYSAYDMNLCLYVYICMNTYIYICTYIHMYRHATYVMTYVLHVLQNTCERFFELFSKFYIHVHMHTHA